MLIGQDRPQDYLSAAFHADRRAAVRSSLPENSVALFFANPVRNRANDVDYVYHQDPDFYYLTGIMEPHAVLLISKSPIPGPDGEMSDTHLFVQSKNKMAEMWTGRRLGPEGGQELTGLDAVYAHQEFAEWEIDFTSFDKVLFLGFKEDVRDGNSDSDLYDLISQFKEKADYPDDFEPKRYELYSLIKTTELDNSANVAQTVGRYLRRFGSMGEEDPLEKFVNASDQERKDLVGQLPETNLDISLLDYIMNSLREIKLPDEMTLLRKAIRISAMGQREVMKAMHPNMSETEVQGIHEFVYKKYGAEYEGYPSIVGAGDNACILHYIDNIRPQLKTDLVLMDLGAEYHGYTADVTRTIPADGTFSPEQRAIYDLVYEAQEAAFAACKPGASFNAPHLAAKAVIDAGLLELGLIKENAFHMYFPHGTSHFLGLDVHDRGNYDELREGMVITVEPGIYIPMDSKCDEKWWGIGVRIEDDVLITSDGYELLSGDAPRQSTEIEALMAEPSALDDFVLPDLE